MGHHIKLNGNIIGGEADASLFGYGKGLETRLNRLKSLVEKTGLVSVNAAIEHEDIGRLHWLSYTEPLRCLDIICAVEELWASLTVQPLAKLICRAEVAGWDIVLD